MIKPKGLGRGLDALLGGGKANTIRDQGVLRDIAIGDLSPGKFIEGHRRRAHDLRIVGHIFEHGTLRRNLNAVADLEMAGESALARDENVIAQLGGAGDANL